MAGDTRQEILDTFYHQQGPCCAGCDWWHSISTLVGECHRSAMVSGHDRMIALGIDYSSLAFGAGHVVTKREHVCGDFKDEFDWTSLPLPYRKRVGALAERTAVRALIDALKLAPTPSQPRGERP
ncbi:hypothetical protein [Methylobacterium sp. Gmos1]